MILAVTGGTGFVGGHLLRLAVAQGHVVRALARSPQPETPGVTWIAGDLATPGALCAGANAVIHIAGTINGRDRAAYDAGNVTGTASIVAAAHAARARRFVHVSSLAAREPGLSDYGASKAAAEGVVRESWLDHVIVRPPGVYGPGDRETLTFFQMVTRGFAVLPGRGRFSLIEVGDLAAALLATAASDVAGTIEVDDDGGGYTYAGFAEAIGVAVGRRPWPIRPPLPLLRVAASVDTRIAAARGRLPTLSRGRVATFAHPDWVAACGAGLPRDLWQARVDLASGLKQTVAWYRAQGWLR